MKGNKGFTLIELMIVVAIIAIIASIAIPNLLSARLSANETAAIATLRNLSSAQAQVQASGAIDSDGDGSGEYGYFGELSGKMGVRIFSGGVASVSATQKIVPPVMSGAFGNVAASVVSRSGYNFQIWLPTDITAVGLPEALTGGAGGTLPGSDLCETTWCAYAWPINRQNSGNRAFMVNQQGDVLQCLNIVAMYSGATKPAPGAAFAPPPDGTTDAINSPLAVTTLTKTGQDNEVWSNVQ